MRGELVGEDMNEPIGDRLILVGSVSLHCPGVRTTEVLGVLSLLGEISDVSRDSPRDSLGSLHS